MRTLHPSLTNVHMIQIVKSNVQQMTLPQAKEYAQNLRLGGYSDWRIPTQSDYYHNPTTDTSNNEGYNIAALYWDKIGLINARTFLTDSYDGEGYITDIILTFNAESILSRIDIGTGYYDRSYYFFCVR